jgi:murein DD-endopeptidase MepM/ murein hydrolase activator NlpD
MAFTIEMSSPFPAGFLEHHGGPRSGGHHGPRWYIEYGMDLGAAPGTEVRAAFDAHVTVFPPYVPGNDSGSVFGAQLFLRSLNDKMGGFYTHITHVPSGIAVGSQIHRGDLLGRVHPGGHPPHLHMALVEIIGGVPRGRYVGVNLFRTFLNIANTTRVIQVTFHEDGRPPTVSS